ncbi:hypothetical protein F4782DRAFT_50156 [Xylaria castorea]|nr:hypothetical protein F4782DRAFT_50156 [Xylaria castorea]
MGRESGVGNNHPCLATKPTSLFLLLVLQYLHQLPLIRSWGPGCWPRCAGDFSYDKRYLLASRLLAWLLSFLVPWLLGYLVTWLLWLLWLLWFPDSIYLSIHPSIDRPTYLLALVARLNPSLSTCVCVVFMFIRRPGGAWVPGGSKLLKLQFSAGPELADRSGSQTPCSLGQKSTLNNLPLFHIIPRRPTATIPV